MALAASAELRSEHPLAAAVVSKAKEEGIAVETPQSFLALSGSGVGAVVGGQEVLVGSRRLMEERGVAGLTASGAQEGGGEEEGRTLIFVSLDGVGAGALLFEDEIKPGALETVRGLRRMGLRVALITGDRRRAAEEVGRCVGIEEVVAEARPEEKVACVERFSSLGGVAMVGDGINDAPALAAAEVGIAMGRGSDVAIESADVTLAAGELGSVAEAIDLSRRAMRTIRQNLVFSFAYNAAAIPLAAGALAPLTGWSLSPMIAAAAMAMSSLSVVANSLRLKGSLEESGNGL